MTVPRRPIRLALGVLALLAPAACQDPYLARRDTLTVGSGDAVHANIAKQVIDPWPAHAQQIEPTTNGERAQHAMERYRNPGAGPGGGLGVLPPVPTGPSAAPPPSAAAFR